MREFDTNWNMVRTISTIFYKKLQERYFLFARDSIHSNIIVINEFDMIANCVIEKLIINYLERRIVLFVIHNDQPQK